MSLRAEAVKALAGWTPPDEEQQALRDLYLAHLCAHPDGVSRACRPGHITASTAVLDAPRRRVLLTLHGKIGRWLQLGGHCEPGDATLAAAALREATEESGITGIALLEGPVNLDLHAVPCGLAARQAGPSPAGHPAAGAARSAGPTRTVEPAGPVEPVRPAGPAGPVEPVRPVGWVRPVGLTGKSGSAGPVGLADPVEIADQVGPLGTAGPVGWTWHLDVQFVAISPPGGRPVRSDESDDLRWWPVDSLPSSADDALRRLVARACALSH